MKEKDLTTLWTHWLKVYGQETAVYELKICKEKSLPFSRLEEHQERALYMAKHSQVVFKIPDCGFQNPFDLAHWKGVKAYVGVFWNTRRGQKDIVLIDIDAWIAEKEKGLRKSLTYDDCLRIGTLYQL
jgi:hypothetical protein